MKSKKPESNSLFELYEKLNLRIDWIQPIKGFTINNLKDIAFELPYQSPSFRPNYFSLLFVKSGKGKYSIDEHTFNFETHSIYFTNPSNHRTFHWDELEEAYLITFDETFLKKYVGKDIFSSFPFLLTETLSPKVAADDFFKTTEEIYLQIEKEYQEDSIEKHQIIGHLLAVLLYKIKAYFWQNYNPIYEGNRSSQIVKSFKLQLEKHYRDLNRGIIDVVFRVQDYADAQNLHPNYLSNVIKTKTGKTISDWITQKTIIEAKTLLQNKSLSIKEIAHKLSFSETAHFSNYFKKQVGMSPNQFRKL
ncbi:helix-turn-helix domain-containing protein [Cellulophaga baltica]|uniref:helix-turn-helix domain-containing protein n=1 Tax=Cellulophaga TaxID=104264 RepID=UPI001C067D6B|nr:MULTISPECIES: helix-turn-helix domain-containing protein [Cellulophaga]MBU2998111.1 helix-turn-helix domain-containing protein [Cellulophaga baltica]MDO6769515.1 helix-turn-helix domain-containing protein [Cellulophaga sp. 1_MG-2023]